MKRILVVEDDESICEVEKILFESEGYEVLTAANGKEALDSLASNPRPDLIVLDLMMPEMDGFQVLEKIRTNPDQKLAKTPVIVLSNLWSNEDILKTQALNASAYMVKAYFTPDEIVAKVNEVLSGKSN